MSLKNLAVKTKKVTIKDVLGLKGFNVTISAVSRELARKLRESAESQVLNSKYRTMETKFDEDKFVEALVDTAILGWTGLKYKYLPSLMLVDLSSVEDKESELEFSKEDAMELVKSSQALDNWLNENIFNLDNFRD